MIEINPSPIESIEFEGHSFLVKRDDLLHPDFSGNKARKFHYLLSNDLKGIKTIVSHGGTQSNAMYSLSVLAKMKKLKFVYYTNHVSKYIREFPEGNFKFALQNGMELRLGKFENFDKSHLFIPQGGAFSLAQEGIKLLADELNTLYDNDIFLPSGTGTTALYLQKYLNLKVYTCACVGDREYLQKQFLNLEPDISKHPTILSLDKKYHFGKPYPEFYDIWIKLKQDTAIEFDLLYDPPGWLTLLQNRSKMGKNVLYIHQGGLMGNESMIQRYKRKFDEINQL